MLTYFVIAGSIVLAGLVIFLIYVATLPGKFAITRSAILPGVSLIKLLQSSTISINGTTGRPGPNFDPNSKTTFGGPPTGVGAKFAWNGKKVGSGNMTIVDSRPNDSIKIDLTFTKPMKANNVTLFTFKPEAASTRVTWSMSGVNGFMGKLFGVLINCDKMCGDQFESGFANMKEVLASGVKV